MRIFGPYILMVIGAIIGLVTVFASRRQGEAEFSQSLYSMPTFLIGLLLVVIGVILKIVLH